MKAIRKKFFRIILCCAIVVFGGIVAVYFAWNAARFQSMPDDAKVRDITSDAMGITYYITDEKMLYVDGCARDSFGIYQSGFRWEYLYGFLSPDKPVLFSENVDRVFEGNIGFLYTDTDQNLFFFGNGSEGEPCFIADDVIFASLGMGNIVYVCANGSVYETTLTNGRCTEHYLIAENGKEAYTNTVDICILDNNGEFHKIARHGFDGNSRPQEKKETLASNVKSIQDVIKSDLVLTQSNSLTYYKVHGWINGTGWENPIGLTDGATVLDDVCYCDYNPNTGIVTITDDGRLLLMQPWGKPEHTVLKKLDTTDNIVDLTAGNDRIYIVFSDGRYQAVETAAQTYY